jgi:hypothetical protein
MNIEIMLSAGSISLDSTFKQVVRHVLIPTYEVCKLGENKR